MRSIVWFRKDLRVQDNKALFEAVEESFDGVVGLYIIDESLWKKNHTAACHVEFVLRGVAELSKVLSKLGIPLLIRQVDNTDNVPDVVLAVAKQVNATNLCLNQEYELSESQRDESVKKYLEAHQIKTHLYHDQTVLPLRKEHARTFDMYRKLWIKQCIQQGGIKLTLPIYEQRDFGIASDPVPTELENFKSTVNPKLWPAGEHTAIKRLDKFMKILPLEYEQRRDYPAFDGTSKLSPYLATGMISPRQCFLAALELNDHRLGSGDVNAVAWMNEFIWRDFYKHIVYTVPAVCLGEPYQKDTKKVKWTFDEKQFEAWKIGKTGFPIVDAAMRQLKTMGWIHPRLRLITATFFTKYMFFDWRLGEKFFMNHLIDGDFALNNGGWQFCASTGTDTAAYFRYFDPIRQSERYDPDGQFIREYCKELKEFTDYAVHSPYTRAPSQVKKTKYPQPLLELKESRVNAIAGFRKGTK